MKIIPTPETLAIDKAATDMRKHLAAASSDDLVKYLRASPTSLVMEAAADRIAQLEGMLAAVGAVGVSRHE